MMLWLRVLFYPTFGYCVHCMVCSHLVCCYGLSCGTSAEQANLFSHPLLRRNLVLRGGNDGWDRLGNPNYLGTKRERYVNEKGRNAEELGVTKDKRKRVEIVLERPSGNAIGGQRVRGDPRYHASQLKDARMLTGKIKHCSSISELLGVVREHGPDMNHIHISAVWVATSRLGLTPGGNAVVEETVRELKARTREMLGAMGGRQVANVLHALVKLPEAAKLAGPSEEVDFLSLVEGLQTRAEIVLRGSKEGFNAQETSNMLWALATLGAPLRGGLVNLLVRRACVVSSDFGPQGVANVLWALAKIGTVVHARQRRELLLSMQNQTAATAQKFVARDVARILWALATMEAETVELRLLQPLLQRAEGLCQGSGAQCFAPQDVCNLLWASVSVGAALAPALRRALLQRAAAAAGKFKAQEVASLLWAIAKSREVESRGTAAVAEVGKFRTNEERGVVEALAKRAGAVVNDLTSQGVANIGWALASLDLGANRWDVWRLLLERAFMLAEEFKPQEVAGFTWALATVGERGSEQLWASMSQQAQKLAGEFMPQELAGLMWAAATLGLSVSDALRVALGRRAAEVASSFGAQELAMLLWALAALGAEHDASFSAATDTLAARALSLWGQFEAAGQCQLHQWLLAWKLCPVDRRCHELSRPRLAPVESVRRLRRKVARRLRETFCSRPTRYSKLQAGATASARAQASQHLTSAGLSFPSQLPLVSPRTNLRRGQREVEDVLRGSGVLPRGATVEAEARDRRSGYSIDLLVCWPSENTSQAMLANPTGRCERRTAVEVDGPTHFLQVGQFIDQRSFVLIKSNQLSQRKVC